MPGVGPQATRDDFHTGAFAITEPEWAHFPEITGDEREYDFGAAVLDGRINSRTKMYSLPKK